MKRTGVWATLDPMTAVLVLGRAMVRSASPAASGDWVFRCTWTCLTALLP